MSALSFDEQVLSGAIAMVQVDDLSEKGHDCSDLTCSILNGETKHWPSNRGNLDIAMAREIVRMETVVTALQEQAEGWASAYMDLMMKYDPATIAQIEQGESEYRAGLGTQYTHAEFCERFGVQNQ